MIEKVSYISKSLSKILNIQSSFIAKKCPFSTLLNKDTIDVTLLIRNDILMAKTV